MIGLTEHLKGLGRVMVFFDDGRRQLQLMTFSDASWAIHKNGKTVGLWEPDEQEDCFRTFAALTGLREALNSALVTVLAERASQPDCRLSAEGPRAIPRESLN